MKHTTVKIQKTIQLKKFSFRQVFILEVTAESIASVGATFPALEKNPL